VFWHYLAALLLRRLSMNALEQIIRQFAWVVGPLYDPNDPRRSIGYRAIKGWHVINLDDAAEEAVTLRATTPEDLLEKVKAYEVELERLHEEGKKKHGN